MTQEKTNNKIKHKYLEFLSPSDLENVHSASLSILEETGVKVLHSDSLKIFKEVGAIVDFDKKLVKIPGHIVENWIAKAPASFKIYARNDGPDLHLTDGIVNYVSTHGIPYVYDIESGERRSSTCEDAKCFSKLSDALPYMADAYCVVHPLDVPDHAAHAHIVKAQIKNSIKPIKGRINGKDVACDCIKMAEMVMGGTKELRQRPILHALVSCLSPLTLDNLQIEGMIEYVKLGLPVNISTAIGAGSTGPVTLLGTLVQHTAEVLAHITLAQVINPGTPVMYGSAAGGIDMRTGSLRYGAVETGLISSAIAQMSRFYKIPCRVSAGATDSKILDMQAGFESSTNLLMASLSGANYISNSAGAVELALTASYEKMVIDHEIISGIARIGQGISTGEASLAGNLIKTVGPGGEYITSDHTLEHFREENFFPELVDSWPFETWQNKKQKNIKDRAKEKVKEILSNHQGPSLDDKLSNALTDYVKSIESRKIK